MQITFRNENGRVMTWDVEELLSIDGQPYKHGLGGEVEQQLAYLAGRLDTLEKAVFPPEVISNGSSN